MLSPRLPVTLSLVFGSVFFALIVGMALGILSAGRGRVLPKVVDIGSVFGLAVPGYWLAVVLNLILAVKFRVFPATGYVAPTDSPGEWLRSIVLPSVALGVGLATFVAKQTRDPLTAALSSDFIRTPARQWGVEVFHPFQACPAERGNSRRYRARSFFRGRSVRRRLRGGRFFPPRSRKRTRAGRSVS